MRRRRGRGDALERERREIAEYLAHEVARAETFAKLRTADGPRVSEAALCVAEFLRKERFLGRPGSVALLMETWRKIAGESPQGTREKVLEWVVAVYERYYEELRKGGYL